MMLTRSFSGAALAGMDPAPMKAPRARPNIHFLMVECRIPLCSLVSVRLAPVPGDRQLFDPVKQQAACGAEGGQHDNPRIHLVGLNRALRIENDKAKSAL